MAFDPVAFKKTKHILRAGIFLRDLVAKRVLTLKRISGNNMVADRRISLPIPNRNRARGINFASLARHS